MSFEQNLRATSIPASADLSASQFRFVDQDVNGNLVQCSASGQRAVGVLQDKPNALGQEGSVALVGQVSKVVAGAAVNAGASVMSDTTGRAITAVAATGNNYLGIAQEAATAAGAIIAVLLNGPSLHY